MQRTDTFVAPRPILSRWTGPQSIRHPQCWTDLQAATRGTHQNRHQCARACRHATERRASEAVVCASLTLEAPALLLGGGGGLGHRLCGMQDSDKASKPGVRRGDIGHCAGLRHSASYPRAHMCVVVLRAGHCDREPRQPAWPLTGCKTTAPVFSAPAHSQ